MRLKIKIDWNVSLTYLIGAVIHIKDVNVEMAWANTRIAYKRHRSAHCRARFIRRRLLTSDRLSRTLICALKEALQSTRTVGHRLPAQYWVTGWTGHQRLSVTGYPGHLASSRCLYLLVSFRGFHGMARYLAIQGPNVSCPEP